jgi:hypothetical protein
MMRHAKFALLILVTACAGVSGPTVRVTKLSPEPFEPRPANYTIRIYRENQPRCAFDKIALLSTDQTPDLRTTDDLDEVLRVKAREVGGDAVINLASETRTGSNDIAAGGGVDGRFNLNRIQVWSGTAVRFKSPKCAE